MEKEEKKQYMKEWRANNPNYRREYYENNKRKERLLNKEWDQNNKEKKLKISRKASLNYRKKNPEKCEARSQISREIKKGNIPSAKRNICYKCNSQAKEYHHPDYSQPLKVLSICGECHNEVCK